MSDSQPTLTRRTFLSRLAAGSASATLLTTGAVPQTILAANQPETPQQLDADFIAGIVVGVDAEQVEIQAPGYGPPVTVLINADSQVCRGSCVNSTALLKVGDRAEASTFSGEGGIRTARWLNANLIAGWACVTAIQGNDLTLEPMPYKEGPERVLTIYPYTRVSTDQGSFLGRTDALSVNDMIHFTSSADTPDPQVRHLMGGHLHKTAVMPSAT